MLRLKSVRKDDHERIDTCIVHAPGFCLSAAAI
jgi:protein-L-isoaspartate(D-aspartate) O-methyltransferase